MDVKPIAGTGSCMARHTDICESGSMTVRADDGTELTIGLPDLVPDSMPAWHQA
jgi:hypothetical protein